MKLKITAFAFAAAFSLHAQAQTEIQWWHSMGGALAGMAVAVCADVDAAQFAAVLRVVVAAGRNGTVDRLVFHDAIPPCWFVSQSLAA